MITRIGILDELSPAVAAWLKDLNPAAGRALMKGGRLIRRQAVANVGATFKRTGRNRTLGGQRGIKLRMDQSAGIRTLRIWHGSGILAAHEIGAAIPAVTIRPKARRVIAWGGPPGGPHTNFARVVNRRGFTLRRRPTLIPAYEATASQVFALIDEEYQTLLDLVPPAVKTDIRV